MRFYAVLRVLVNGPSQCAAPPFVYSRIILLTKGHVKRKCQIFPCKYKGSADSIGFLVENNAKLRLAKAGGYMSYMSFCSNILYFKRILPAGAGGFFANSANKLIVMTATRAIAAQHEWGGF